MSPHRRNLVLFVLLLVGLRGFLVLSLADVFEYGEELAKSCAAKVMLDGIGLPHYQLIYGYHEGGGFVVSHLEALGFLLLGPCVLVIKLVAIGFALATLLTGMWMLADHVSTRAAYVFAAFFALAPETFQRVSLLSLGTHVEASLFILLAFHFVARTLRGDAADKHAPFWMGVVGGFGCYVGLQMPAALIVCGVAILISIRGKPLVGVVGRALVGFAIGAIPLWWMMSHVGIDGLLIHREAQAASRPGFLESLPLVVISILQSRDPLTWLQAISFVVVIVWGLVFRRTRLQWILLGYLLVFVVLWGASGLATPPNPLLPWFHLLRLVPPWLVVTLLAAIGIDTLWARGGAPRVVALVTMLITISAGIRGTITLASAGRPGTPIENARILANTRGYSYQLYFENLKHRIVATRAQKVAVLMRTRDDPALLAPDIANVLYGMEAFKAPAGTTERLIENVLPEMAEAFGPHRNLALLGAGQAVNGFWNYDIAAAFAKLETLPEDTREALAEGLGRTGDRFKFRADKLAELFAVEPPERWRDAWFRGVGWRMHQTFRFRPDLARAAIAQLPEPKRAAATIGFERALRVDSSR